MTPRIEKTVFICYRRTNKPWALAIYANLTARGFDVFFDYTNIPSGDFENVILENIKSRAHFLVILTPSSLERCNEPRDWLRREIETAIDGKRNVIPLMLEGFDFGSPSTNKYLTGKLAKLKYYNGIHVPVEYFSEAMDRLRDGFLNLPIYGTSAQLPDIDSQPTSSVIARIKTTSRSLNVFLCHASEDKPIVRELYGLLIEDSIDAWLDEEKILPGQDWDLEIERAVKKADAVIVCLSKTAVSKEGYIQKELNFVLEKAREKPKGTIFIIPIRLDDCKVPESLIPWQYVDYFPTSKKEWAHQRLFSSLRQRAESLKL